MYKFKKFIFGILFFIIAVSFLSIEIENTFVCNKEMPDCEYKIKTFTNRKFKLKTTYPLKDITEVKYNFYQTVTKSRRGREKIKDHHQILLTMKYGDYPYPLEFSKAEDAQTEAEKFKAYLNSDEQLYTYSKTRNQYVIFVMLLLFGTLSFYFLRIAFRKENIENENNEKEVPKTVSR